MAVDNSLAATATKRPPLPSTGSTGKRAEERLKRFNEAKKIREGWETMWQECYDYSMPNRSGFWEDDVRGSKNTDDILDSTAVHALTDFTSRIKSGVVPDGSRWVDLQPGPDTPVEDLEDVTVGLEGIATNVFEALLDSNASSETDEAITEMSIGTGLLHVDDGGLEAPYRFAAVPLSEVWINQGPFGSIDEVYRRMKPKAEDIVIRWPDANIPRELASIIEKEPRRPIELIESTSRNWKSEEIEYKHEILWKEAPAIIWEKDLIGEGSNPWIVFRWAKGAGEVWGRGPLLSTLPDIRTTNLTVELILENAEKSIAGMWQSDDETINPQTIAFVPGTIITKMPGSSGLEPLKAPGTLDFAQMILSDMRDNIKRGLFSDPLGPTGTTPQSATEASFRISDLNRRISSPFGRMVSELVKPLVKRLVYIRREQGKIEIPRLNGGLMKIVPVSPLAKAADQEMILTIDRYLEQMAVRFGPEMTNQVIKPDQAAVLLAQLHGVPLDLVRTSGELREVAENMAAMVAERAEGAGISPQQLQQAVA
jgi:hypothetical protein